MTEREISKPVSFPAAFFGCCRGTAVFPALRRNRWWRVLAHLLLLSILCAGFITWGELRRFAPLFQEFGRRFEAEFGGAALSPEGIVPLKDPDRGRVFALPFGGAIDYRPAAFRGAGISQEDARTLGFLFYWRPKLLMTGIRSEEEWLLLIQRPGAESGVFRQIPADRLEPFLAKQSGGEDGRWKLLAPEEETIGAAEIVTFLRDRAGASLMLLRVCMCFGLSLLYTTVFVAVFRLTGGVRRLRSMTAGEFWKVGIYAGFPVMPVAACFPAFQLPLFSYGTVFMIGLIVYWLTAAGRMEREKNREAGGNEER